MKNEKTKIKLNFEEFLKEILTSPARLHECYNFFYNYSHRNKLLAMFQMDKPEPINTYKGWQALGRQVKKGAKAICLTMPVIIKDENKDGEEVKKVIYIPKNYWFKLSDTDGEEYSPMAQVPEFNFDLALKNLALMTKIDDHISLISIVLNSMNNFTDSLSLINNSNLNFSGFRCSCSAVNII
jgi:hypothetical protein